MRKNPDKTSFNPVVHTWTPAKFKKYFEQNFEGDWKKYYKGEIKPEKKDDN